MRYVTIIHPLSDEGVKVMHEVMAVSDTVRYRVFDIIIDSILQSDQALEHAVKNGLLSSLIKVIIVLYIYYSIILL